MYHIVYDNEYHDYNCFYQKGDKLCYEPGVNIWTASIASAIRNAELSNWTNTNVAISWARRAIYSGETLPTIDTHPELFL